MIPANRADFLATVPTSARAIVQRAFAGKAAPRGAIKAMRLTCSEYDRAEVADCTVILCPLHAYRPFRPPGEGRQKMRRAPARPLNGPSRATTPTAGGDTA